MRRIKYLLIGFVILAIFYVMFLSVQFLQLQHDKDICTNTKLDQMDRETYQFCINNNWWGK